MAETVARDRNYDREMEAWSDILPTLREFAERTHLTLIVGNPHGKQSEVKTVTGKLFIRFYSSPGQEGESGSHHDYPRVFGRETQGGVTDGIRVSNQGWVMRDGNNVEVAEVIGGTLFIPFDLPHDPRNAAWFLGKILRRYEEQAVKPEGFTRRATPGLVTHLGGNMYEYYDGDGGVKAVLTRWSTSLGKEIWVENHHERSRAIKPLETEGVVKVHFMCSPLPDGAPKDFGDSGIVPLARHVSQFWEIPVSSYQREYGVAPASIECDQIVDPSSGTVAAQVIKGNIFILPAVIYGPTAPQLVDRIMQEYEFLILPPGERARRREEHERVLAAKAKEDWQRFCLTQTRAQLGALQEQEAGARNTIEGAAASLIASTRTLELVRVQRAALEQLLVGSTKRQEEEYARLMAIEGVEKVFLDGSVISIDVGQIDIAYGESVYDIGKFRLTVDLVRGAVQCLNLTRQSGDGHQHPHVGLDGSPCLGNIKEAVTKMIARYEIATLVIVMQQFLRSVNPGGEYVRVTSFPIKKTEEAPK